jgi:DNA invertase Pin-like site-specific DNA recombinase
MDQEQVRAAIYARISQDRSGAQAGVTRQLEDTRKLAADRGWEVVEEFVDNDVSARQRRWSTSQRRFVNTTRPRYEALLDAIQEGRVDAVLAWHPDRLYRRIRDLEDLVDMLERNNVDVVTVKAAKVNLSTAADRLNARLLGSVAMYESEIKSERVAAAAGRRARDGKFSGGMRPYGYERDGVTIREEEARHLRAAYNGILAGRSLAEVTRRLTAAGSTSSTGRPWTPQHLRIVLLSPRFAGLATHRGAIVGEAVWPALVDREAWETVRAILSDPARRTTPGNAPRHLLSGVTFCARQDCGRPCRVSTTGGTGRARRLVYRCPRGHVSRSKELLERFVTEVTLAYLEREGVRPEPVAEDVDASPARDVEVLRQRLEAVAVDFAEGVVTKEQFHAATRTLRARIAELDAALAASTRSRAMSVVDGVPDLRQAWDGFDLDTRRAVVRALWRVELAPMPTGKSGVHPGGVRIMPAATCETTL